MITPTTKSKAEEYNPSEQYYLPEMPFDAYDPEESIRQALGSDRTRRLFEIAELRSVNFIPGMQGWRLTPRGLEIYSFDLLDGGILLSAIEDITDARILGRAAGSAGPVQEISAGAGIVIAGGTISSAVSQYTDEQAQDAVGNAVGNGLDYDDPSGAISVDETELAAASIGGFNEAAQDAIGAEVDASLTYVDATPSLGVTQAYRRKSLFGHFADVGNVGTGEDDLYSDTIAAGQLANNGEKIEAEYGGVFVSSGTATRQLRIYFGGTLIFDTGALSLSLSAAWVAYVSIIRVSSSVVRCIVSLTTEGAALAAYTAYVEVTGLTLANTQVLKITGEAAGIGAATDDIVAKMASVEWKAAA